MCIVITMIEWPNSEMKSNKIQRTKKSARTCSFTFKSMVMA